MGIHNYFGWATFKSYVSLPESTVKLWSYGKMMVNSNNSMVLVNYVGYKNT